MLYEVSSKDLVIYGNLVFIFSFLSLAGYREGTTPTHPLLSNNVIPGYNLDENS